MALMECFIRSSVLSKACNINVLVPQHYEADGVTPGKRQEYKVLYLLHGLSDDYSSWLRRTSIERYIGTLPVVVVMPDAGRSFYTDMKHGLKYWTFISEELPLLIQQLFPVSTKREDTFVAGFSMGGYGALKLALNHPERFAAAGAMSSVTDIAAKFGDPRYAGWQFEDIFGAPELLASDGNDLFASLDKSAKLTTKPRIIQICGTEDYLWQDNLKLKEAFEKNNYSDYVFESHPGAHSWDFWDLYIQTILKFFFQQ